MASGFGIVVMLAIGLVVTAIAANTAARGIAAPEPPQSGLVLLCWLRTILFSTVLLALLGVSSYWMEVEANASGGPGGPAFVFLGFIVLGPPFVYIVVPGLYALLNRPQLPRWVALYVPPALVIVPFGVAMVRGAAFDFSATLFLAVVAAGWVLYVKGMDYPGKGGARPEGGMSLRGRPPVD